MNIIGNVIVPDALFADKFSCDLSVCKGACCIEGDAGAPLEIFEISILEDLIDAITPYLTPEGRSVIEKNGVFDFDMEGNFVTPLINEKECAYLYFDSDGIAKCAIEKAWEAGNLKNMSDDDDFMKPVSCHLYPIRITEKPNGFFELHHHKWDICFCARKKGKETGVSVFEFLKAPLIRKFGKDWYENALQFSKKR
ncbi:MAG: DUF3109 family protein [Bacteroidales bacterium]|jgi:hypothetical protein|nr:DUF3109 family protein [Bacteroidales bacterium]